MNVLASPHGAQVAGIWILVIVLAALAVGLWLLPIFVAHRRRSPNVNQVVVVDLLLGGRGSGGLWLW